MSQHDTWRRDLEDVDALKASASVLPKFTAYKSAAPVERPWAIHQQQSQGAQGSCQGHGLTFVGEVCEQYRTGRFVELSRQYAYIETQRIDGLLGRDQGSTINGGVKLATTKGLCEESLWPYTGRYHTSPPGRSLQECYENAKQHVMDKHFMMESYDDVLAFIDQGIGAITIGIAWDGGYMNRPVLESWSAGRGGHAIALCYKSPRADYDGRPYIWMANSHGERFGLNGWSEWSPKAISQMLNHRWTVAVGVTDMSEPKPRKFNWKGLI